MAVTGVFCRYLPPGPGPLLSPAAGPKAGQQRCVPTCCPWISSCTHRWAPWHTPSPTKRAPTIVQAQQDGRHEVFSWAYVLTYTCTFSCIWVVFTLYAYIFEHKCILCTQTCTLHALECMLAHTCTLMLASSCSCCWCCLLLVVLLLLLLQLLLLPLYH